MNEFNSPGEIFEMTVACKKYVLFIRTTIIKNFTNN